MNRSSFLKFLAAPLLAPVLKFLPKREKPKAWYKIREHFGGPIYGIAMEDIPEGHSGMVRVIMHGDGMRQVWLKDD